MSDHEQAGGTTTVSRRDLLRRAGYLAAAGAIYRLAPAYAWAPIPAGARAGDAAIPGSEDGGIDLEIAQLPFGFSGRNGHAIAVNGSVPGPLLRLRAGQEAVIRVTNRLSEWTSIHWHGILLPPEMDGVPGVSFAGIAPGQTFVYRFPVRQSGTYWAHGHWGDQELRGLYFPLIIDPAQPEPLAYDRDYVLVLSDWSFEQPPQIVAKLKKQAGYYNFQRRTLADFIRDVRRAGWSGAVADRLAWGRMRMDPTDFADVTGATYTYLLNGLPPEPGWSGLFRPGERVRLRVIAAGAMTYFDLRIPDLPLTVVQADGQWVEPVRVDELRIGPGETYDLIVEPEDRAYTVFAESLDRSGFARGTLAPRAGMTAAVPALRPRPVRTMRDMGMVGHEGMGGMEMGAAAGAGPPSGGDSPHDAHAAPPPPPSSHQGHAQPPSSAGVPIGGGDDGASLPGEPPVPHGPDDHGPGNSSVPASTGSRAAEVPNGLQDSGRRVLVYADLRSPTPQPDARLPEREVELHLTGNMERYMWSFDGKKYSEKPEPIPFRYGERLRIVLVNDTMMEHPIHLHGMWMELENGAGTHAPRKHTVSVQPAERMSLLVTADAPGRWAMHCHLLLHMEMGMFRVVEVSAAAEVTV
jgi:CopA family copper-resistance protein